MLNFSHLSFAPLREGSRLHPSSIIHPRLPLRRRASARTLRLHKNACPLGFCHHMGDAAKKALSERDICTKYITPPLSPATSGTNLRFARKFRSPRGACWCGAKIQSGGSQTYRLYMDYGTSHDRNNRYTELLALCVHRPGNPEAVEVHFHSAK